MDLQKGAADKHAIHFSVGAIYILRLGEGGLGKEQNTACLLAFNVISQMPFLAKASAC